MSSVDPRIFIVCLEKLQTRQVQAVEVMVNRIEAVRV